MYPYIEYQGKVEGPVILGEDYKRNTGKVGKPLCHYPDLPLNKVVFILQGFTIQSYQDTVFVFLLVG